MTTGKITLAEEFPLLPQLPPSSRIEALLVVHAYPVASVFPALPGAVYVLAMTTATTFSPPTPVAHMPYARSITVSASAVAHKVRPLGGPLSSSASLIRPAYASILEAHVVAALTLHGFVLAVYGFALVAHKPMLDCRHNVGHSWTNEPPEPGGARQ
jgi:hypothetical protein